MNKEKLLKHQQIALTNLKNNQNCLLVRLPGSGKTRIAIELINYINPNKVLWISPANLCYQILEENKEWGKKESIRINKIENFVYNDKIIIISYDFARMHHKKIINSKIDLLIVDEAHHLKNNKTGYHKTVSIIRLNSNRILAMTATPFQNTPQEFFSILSIIAGRYLNGILDNCLQYERTSACDIFISVIREFGLKTKRRNRGQLLGIKNKKKILKIIKPIIDYLPDEYYEYEMNFPQIHYSLEHVEMTEYEIEHYYKEQKKLKRYQRNALKGGYEDNQISRIFNSLYDLRKSLIVINGNPTSKTIVFINFIKKAISENDAKILAFTNFVDMGVNVICGFLKKINIKYLSYTGELSQEKRNNILSNFISSDSKILVISPVGFEGLNIHGVSHIAILDPHFNPERTKQLIYRAIRLGTDLESIIVKHFIATIPHSNENTVDERILRIAEKKNRINKLFIDILNDN